MENSFSIPFFDIPSGKNPNWEIIGENRRQILILLDYPSEKTQDDFLEKIFSALEIHTTTDVMRLHSNAPEAIHFQELNKNGNFKQVVSFGVPFADLGLRFRYQAYQPIFVGNQGFLFVDSLPVIHAQRIRGIKEKSLLLWNALKQLFNHSQG